MGGFRANSNRCGVDLALSQGVNPSTWFVGLRGDKKLVATPYSPNRSSNPILNHHDDLPLSNNQLLSSCGWGEYGRFRARVKASF